MRKKKKKKTYKEMKKELLGIRLLEAKGVSEMCYEAERLARKRKLDYIG